MNKVEKTIFWIMVAVVALLAVRSIKMQEQQLIAKYNQDQIIEVLLKAEIIQLGEDVHVKTN